MEYKELSKFKLSKENYDLLKNCHFAELWDITEDLILQFNDEECSFETNNVRELQILLNYEISLYGMTDDQMECTENGRALYALYDEIHYQKE